MVIKRLQRHLLLCGAFSSAVYILMNIVTVIMYKGYSVSDQTVSELSAIGAPTRRLWVLLSLVYSLSLALFGWSIRQLYKKDRRLALVGSLFLLNAVIGLFWPPMHQREVLAAGGKTFSDALHIVFTVVTVLIMVVAIVFSVPAFGRVFRIYSLVTLLILLCAGIATGMDAPKIQANESTPWIGIWERVNIGVYMAWVIVFSILMWHRTASQAFSRH